MRQIVRLAALAAATGLAAAAPGPDAKPAADDALSRFLATPRYYAISASGALKGQDGIKMCQGGEALRKMYEGLREASKNPEFVAQLNKGCTHKSEHNATGWASYELTCDRAAGAAFTSRVVIAGTLDGYSQHMETVLPGWGPNGSDKAIVSDMQMTYLGACPDNVKPGQLLQPDGKVVDPMAEISHMAKEAEERKATPAGK